MIDETTADLPSARKALHDSRTARARTQRVIDVATAQVRAITAAREQNHFTEGIRAMLRGTT